jgi:hypothetical protein
MHAETKWTINILQITSLFLYQKKNIVVYIENEMIYLIQLLISLTYQTQFS